MKKVRCPRCSVVNMERFVTFPYCASCGALLPVAEPKPLSRWSRPLGVALWTSIFGATLLALFAAVRVFETPTSPVADVAIYGRAPRYVTVGEDFVLRLSVEAGESQAARNPMLRAVSLRVMRDSFDALTLVEMQPPPDTISNRGQARYFEYVTFDSDDAIKLRLRATRAGHQTLQMRFLVGGQLQTVSTFSFDVRPRGAATSRADALHKKATRRIEEAR